MNIIVQKFGGTSVATKERRSMVMNKIDEAKKAGYAVVVVVSAMGRKGEPYATDTLRGLILEDASTYNLKHLDLLMSCGEVISSVVLASALETMGYAAIPLTGYQAGILTDDTFGSADILSIDSNKILPHLEEGKVVIIAGFQGATKDGFITTLGRGGSDTSATALGVALKAKQVEIYTDVDGIMTADPNVVPKARIIDEINYDEVFQMAEKGAKVIHPRAVEIAQNGNIPVKIKNTMSTHPGTSIHYCRKKRGTLYSGKSCEQLLTAITHKDGIVQVTIYTEGSSDSQLLSALAKASISIDMINFFMDKKVFTIEEVQVTALEAILKDFQVKYSILQACSKVTIIGSRITGIPGVMATVVNALTKEGIKILQTSDSHATISCLVKQEDAKKAVCTLHEAFHLDQ
ncbi:aspartate kinase [Clostridium formicaceticum]|uniref:Aspartokinase n=1 Tax=Clostridium formicaceticum TaxID=1497 RepID=A0AAC9WEU1_9CLOT|nr:aspartate kinase [Clostridium formicaceticum]AOY75775.1 aspartate kinase [Clostridium formicaceticum]ARE86101.1 Aspartokinase [Clostridium formicaceticum]